MWWFSKKKAENRKIQGLLVMSERPLDNGAQLLQQIIDQQKARGYEFINGSKAETRAAGAHLNDTQYVYAAIRETFDCLGGTDPFERAEVFSFQGSDGNQGYYYLVFDRPREQQKAA